MISTKKLSGLPNVNYLKAFCKGLAALDIIMFKKKDSIFRNYKYKPTWKKGKEAFFATDGSEQNMIVMFTSKGCVINGIDSELYDWDEEFPHIEDLTKGMPSALLKLMNSQDVKEMRSTFCVWTEDCASWHCNPMGGDDASKDLLSMIDGKPQTYVKYVKNFPAELPLKIAKQLCDQVPLTKEIITEMNPKHGKFDDIKVELDEIGYPNEL